MSDGWDCDPEAQLAAAPLLARFVACGAGRELFGRLERNGGPPVIQRAANVADDYMEALLDGETGIVWLDAALPDDNCLAALCHEIRHSEQERRGVLAPIARMPLADLVAATWIMEADAFATAQRIVTSLAMHGDAGPRASFWDRGETEQAVLEAGEAELARFSRRLGRGEMMPHPAFAAFRAALAQPHLRDSYEADARQRWSQYRDSGEPESDGEAWDEFLGAMAAMDSGGNVRYPRDFLEVATALRAEAAMRVAARPPRPRLKMLVDLPRWNP